MFQRTITQAAGRQADSTHGTAAQASAARLIRLLREAYPHINTDALTDTTKTSMHQRAQEDQRCLVAYLDNIIGFLESNIATEPPSFTGEIPPSIASSVQMIVYILSHTPHSSENKKRIFLQMKSFAETFPGRIWSGSDKLWSQNKIYNGNTNKFDIVTASLAETLNLVCCSFFDERRYVSSSSEDIRLRIDSFCQSLSELQQRVEQGQYEKCAAGRQHDLLFLLDHAYLDRDKSDPGAKPIELIIDEPTFLFSQLSRYIETQMHEMDEVNRSRLIVDWLSWDGISRDNAPVIIFLRERHPASDLAADQDCQWKAACSSFIKKQCKLFGIYPTALTALITEYIANVHDLALPIAAGSVVTSLLAAIMNAEPIQISLWSGPAMAGLITARNDALRAFKEQAQANPEQFSQPDAVTVLAPFFVALELCQKVWRYGTMAALGSDEVSFFEKRQAIAFILRDYFTEWTPLSLLPANMESIKSDYLKEETLFREKSHVDFIENFFAALKGEPHLSYEYLDRLEAIKTSADAMHSVVLDDHVLDQWFSQGQVINADALVIDLTPYQVNRILLHAVLTSPQEWSANFIRRLIATTEWLQQPNGVEDSLALQTLRASYPRVILNNLLCIALVQQQPDIDPAIKQECAYPDNKDIVLYLMKSEIFLEIIFRRPNRAQLAQALTAFEAYIGTLIHNGSRLASLLFPIGVQEKLSSDQRTQLLTALEPRLVKLIQSHDDLQTLFEVAGSGLSHDYRTQLLTALEPHLGTLNLNVWALIKLFKLRPEQLSYAHRTQLLTGLERHLRTLIQSPGELEALFGLTEEQLSNAHRTQLLTALEPHLGTLIKQGSQLVSLFRLTPEQLSSDQRTQLLTAVQPNLAVRILNYQDIKALFALSKEQLSDEQRKILSEAHPRYTTGSTTPSTFFNRHTHAEEPLKDVCSIP